MPISSHGEGLAQGAEIGMWEHRITEVGNLDRKAGTQVYGNVREIQTQRQTRGVGAEMRRWGKTEIKDVSVGAHGCRDVAARGQRYPGVYRNRRTGAT